MEGWFIKGVDGFNLHGMKYLYEDEEFTDEPKNPDFRGSKVSYNKWLQQKVLNKGYSNNVVFMVCL